MDSKMFCFQCEQTAGGIGCKGNAGVCGKKYDIAGLQDKLTGALIGLARTTDGNTQPTENTYKLLIKGLFTTITNVNFNEQTLNALIDEVHAEKEKIVPNCTTCGSPCGRNDDYDMTKVWDADEDIRSLKSLILSLCSAPVLPAETTASPSPCLRRRSARTSEESVFERTASVGSSFMEITSRASTTWAPVQPSARRIGVISSCRPVRMIWQPSSWCACTAPFTMASGALSPPMASTIIFIVRKLPFPSVYPIPPGTVRRGQGFCFSCPARVPEAAAAVRN